VVLLCRAASRGAGVVYWVSHVYGIPRRAGAFWLGSVVLFVSWSSSGLAVVYCPFLGGLLALFAPGSGGCADNGVRGCGRGAYLGGELLD
jgi:hypothetical protein